MEMRWTSCERASHSLEKEFTFVSIHPLPVYGAGSQSSPSPVFEGNALAEEDAGGPKASRRLSYPQLCPSRLAHIHARGTRIKDVCRTHEQRGGDHSSSTCGMMYKRMLFKACMYLFWKVYDDTRVWARNIGDAMIGEQLLLRRTPRKSKQNWAPAGPFRKPVYVWLSVLPDDQLGELRASSAKTTRWA